MTLARRSTAHRKPALCALLALASLVSPAFAQETPAADEADEPRTRVTVDGGRTTIEQQLPASTRTISMQLPQSTRCATGISLSYLQKDTIASIKGTLENAVCAASSGDYTLAITVRHDSGETQTLEFTEAWARSDDAPLALQADYPIGANVELLRVRTRRSSCTCVEAPVETAAGE